jgi:hypothetical protein
MIIRAWCGRASRTRSDFAGARVDEAVVEPGAVAALDDFDDAVRHYEVIEDVLPKSPTL